MNAVSKTILPVKRVFQVLETLMFTATAVFVAGGTIAVCLPGILDLA